MQFTVLKQEMESCFDQIKSTAQDGGMPDAELVNAFLRLTQKMQAQADEEWMDECLDFVHMVQQLVHAVKKNELSDAIMIVESLDENRNNCHMTFSSE